MEEKDLYRWYLSWEYVLIMLDVYFMSCVFVIVSLSEIYMPVEIKWTSNTYNYYYFE